MAARKLSKGLLHVARSPGRALVILTRKVTAVAIKSSIKLIHVTQIQEYNFH